MYLRTCEKEASIITTKYVTANGITKTETETGSNRARKQREEIIRGVFFCSFMEHNYRINIYLSIYLSIFVTPWIRVIVKSQFSKSQSHIFFSLLIVTS